MNFISIVIPVHNEENNIKNLIFEIKEAMALWKHEIIVVDDGSSDDTGVVLSELDKKNFNLKVITHLKNYGQSAAVYSGVKKSLGNLIATIDGDGQNNPEDIPLLVNSILNNSSNLIRMAAGFRQNRKDTGLKVFSSKTANFLRSYFLKDSINDSGCGLKVFYKESFESLPFFDHMHRFLPALFQIHGFKVLNVRVSHRNRKSGKSHYGTIDRLLAGIIDLGGVWWLKKRQIEIKIRSIV